MSSQASENPFTAVLANSLSNLHISGKYSDLTIRCEETTWKVHKLVMCTHSQFFDNACKGEFMEAKSGEIKLDGDESLVVEAMIRAMYEADYAEVERRDEFLENPLVFHAKVYAIGEKYGILPLKDLARLKTETILKEWTPTYFFDAMNEVYESTIPQDRGLRDLYVHAAGAQGSSLFDNKEFQEKMDQNGQFWKDYSKQLQDKLTSYERIDLKKYTELVCRRCQDYPRFLITTQTYRKILASESPFPYCPVCRRSVPRADVDPSL